MVFANPNWFMKRRNGGWDLATKFVKGLLYILCVGGPFVIFQLIPFWSIQTRILVTGLWIAFLSIEIVDVIRKVKKAEKETTREAISEKNALWGMIIVLISAVFYQIYDSIATKKLSIDRWIVAALIIGFILKLLSKRKVKRN